MLGHGDNQDRLVPHPGGGTAWHPTLRALGVASMQPGGRLDVQEHTRNARSRSLV